MYMIGYEKSTLQRQSHSELEIGKGSATFDYDLLSNFREMIFNVELFWL